MQHWEDAFGFPQQMSQDDVLVALFGPTGSYEGYLKDRQRELKDEGRPKDEVAMYAVPPKRTTKRKRGPGTGCKNDVPLKQREAYLVHIAWNDAPSHAARASGGSYHQFARLRAEDPVFMALVDRAKEIWCEHAARVAQHVALVGCLEPVYMKGLLVGFKRKISERLLEKHLVLARPEMRDRATIEANVGKGGVLVVNGALDEEDWEAKYGAE